MAGMILTVQWDVEFGGELDGVEGTAGEEAVADLQGGDFAAAVVDAEDEILGIGIVLNIHFANFDAAIFQERLGASAIGAPGSAVHDDGFDGIGAHSVATGLDAVDT